MDNVTVKALSPIETELYSRNGITLETSCMILEEYYSIPEHHMQTQLTL